MTKFKAEPSPTQYEETVWLESPGGVGVEPFSPISGHGYVSEGRAYVIIGLGPPQGVRGLWFFSITQWGGGGGAPGTQWAHFPLAPTGRDSSL